MPMLSAQASSRSIRFASKVSACHISSSFIALAGTKFAPTSQPCAAYQSFAFCSVQRDCAATPETHQSKMKMSAANFLEKLNTRVFSVCRSFSVCLRFVVGFRHRVNNRVLRNLIAVKFGDQFAVAHH